MQIKINSNPFTFMRMIGGVNALKKCFIIYVLNF